MKTKMSIIFTGGGGYIYPVYRRMLDVYEHTEKIACKIKEIYKPQYKERIVLICRGTSGITIAISLHAALMKEGFEDIAIAFLRKPHEEGHHGGGDIDLRLSEDADLKNKYIIVDDCVCSGHTIKAMATDLGEYARKVEMVCIHDVCNSELVSRTFTNCKYLIK